MYDISKALLSFLYSYWKVLQVYLPYITNHKFRGNHPNACAVKPKKTERATYMQAPSLKSFLELIIVHHCYIDRRCSVWLQY